MLSKKQCSKIYAILIFIFLTAIYIVPEKIKYESAVFLIFSSILMVASFVNQRKTQTGILLLWIAYLAIGLLSTLFLPAALGDFVEFSVAVLIGITIIYNINNLCYNNVKYILNAVFGVSVVAVIGCVLQMLLPSFLLSFNQMTLGVDKYAMFHDFYRGGRIVGFSFQTGVTGFYLSIFCGFVGCKYLGLKKNTRFTVKLLYLALFFVGYILLFFTGKRSFILIVSALAFLFIVLYNRRHIGKVILICILLLTALIILLSTTDIGEWIFDRSVAGDITTGRSAIYAEMWELFMKNPVFGNGIGSTIIYIPKYQNGHNIYLQVLSETGIIGFAIIISIILLGLKKTFSKLLKKIKMRQDSKVEAISLFVQLIFVGWGLSGNPLYDVYPLLVYMISLGVVAGTGSTCLQRSKNVYRRVSECV